MIRNRGGVSAAPIGGKKRGSELRRVSDVIGGDDDAESEPADDDEQLSLDSEEEGELRRDQALAKGGLGKKGVKQGQYTAGLNQANQRALALGKGKKGTKDFKRTSIA